MKLEDVKNDKEVNVLVDNTERQLTELGYTEHVEGILELFLRLLVIF